VFLDAKFLLFKKSSLLSLASAFSIHSLNFSLLSAIYITSLNSWAAGRSEITIGIPAAK
jgi:hypothetical protein